jgi:apolipoprotein N-acyltransferase
LPLVRAANTGISAIVDPMGRVVAQLGLGMEGVLDSTLPAAIAPTVFARTGSLPAGMLIAAALVVVIVRRVPKRKL